jgi:hypothetical protein
MKKSFICLITFCLVFWALLAYAITFPQDLTAPMEYGETGPYTMSSETFENSMWRLSDGGEPVTVLLPIERSDSAPVLFFSHGFGCTNWMGYRSLLTHLVSWGFAVVYSPYPNRDSSVSERYQILWNGFQEAAERYATQFNLQKVGFLGHSFGAGAIPAMAWKGLVEEGWGTEGAFLFIMAPWYSHDIGDAQLEIFPEYVNMIIQVYNEDNINDHRMAIDIFTNIAIPDSRKAYYNVVEGRFPAKHSVASDRQNNKLDCLAVRRPLDALIDYSFEITDPYEGKNYALDGQGEHFQHTVTKNPTVVADESKYRWQWSLFLNPRFNYRP